jgi:hypothetical protein
MNNPLKFTDPSGNKIHRGWWGLMVMGIIDPMSTSALLTSTAAGGVGLVIGAGITADLSTGGMLSAAFLTTFPFSNQCYELQKYISPIAIKPSFGFGSTNHIGIDISIGSMKSFDGIPSYRWHWGASFYAGSNAYGGYSGRETRSGAEFSIGGVSISGTRFGAGEFSQTTNKITLGGPFINMSYENDYMFNIGKYVLGKYASDNGDRWRSAAVGMNFGPLSINLNMFTGDPGLDGNNRPFEIINGHETYVDSEFGNPNKYRAGILSFGFGPFRFGRNSEQIRCVFQNRFAHDMLTGGKAKWFEVLDIDPSWYFYLGFGSGDTLW